MIILSELFAILSKDVNILIIDEKDNEYTRDTVPVHLLNRYVQVMLPIKDGIEIRVFDIKESLIIEDIYGNSYEYWSDGEYSIEEITSIPYTEIRN